MNGKARPTKGRFLRGVDWFAFCWSGIFQASSAGDVDWPIVGYWGTEIACWTPLTKTARTEKSSSNATKSAQYPGAIFPN